MPLGSGKSAGAVARGGPTRVLLAEGAEVRSRLFSLRWVAETPVSSSGGHVDAIRGALLREHWSDAITLWMESTGTVVDADQVEEVWTEEGLDSETTSLAIRMAPIFE